MNFLILINSAPNYKYFFHEISKELQNRGHKVFYAIDSLRSTFLEPLNAVDNNEHSFFFDQYLEKYFDPSLSVDALSDSQDFWGDYFYSDFDRFLTHDFNLNKNKNYWLNVKICLDNYFSQLIRDHNIDFVLYENISNSFAYAAYLQCQAHGKQYIGLMGSRIPNHFEIQGSIIDGEVEKLKKLEQNPPSREELEWFQNYKNSIVNIQPDYMKQNGLDNVAITRVIKLEKLKKAIRFLTIGSKYNSYFDYQFGNPRTVPLKALRVNWKRFINTIKSQSFYISDTELEQASSTEKFYVYPIHFHPESSTSVLAPEYTNEYNNIINIANNLPFGTYLYVKDHKSAKGVQDWSFYKKISALPNVRLISFNINIKKLISKSLGVITVNSTAGYEALLIEKPVYILGRVFYENFNNVQTISFSDIRNLKHENFNEVSMNFVAYRRYLYKGTIQINFKQQFSLKEQQQYFQNFTDSILEYCNREQS